MTRWIDYMTLSRGLKGVIISDPLLRAAHDRFSHIKKLAHVHKKQIPRFLYPQRITLNINTLQDLVEHGDLAIIRPNIPPHEVLV